MDRPPSRTLQRALEFAGTRERLCEALSVSPEDLDAYITGRSPIPNDVFLAALDVVAGKRLR